jgi:hypothetical protein
MVVVLKFDEGLALTVLLSAAVATQPLTKAAAIKVILSLVLFI